MKINRFTANCFSNECGFCSSCCDSESLSDDSETIKRAKDLKKFMGRQRVDEENDHYNKTLKKYLKRYDYLNPSDSGFMPKRMNYGDNSDTEYNKYHLIQKNHESICNDPLCQVFYESSHDELKSSYYPKLPLYERVKDNKHYICIVCISR